jgi:hypothetical protein
MDYAETIAKAQDTVTVQRVYGEPYEKNGVTLIPAAKMAGGGGAGGGDDPSGGGSGSGGGFGIAGSPCGRIRNQGRRRQMAAGRRPEPSADTADPGGTGPGTPATPRA